MHRIITLAIIQLFILSNILSAQVIVQKSPGQPAPGHAQQTNIQAPTADNGTNNNDTEHAANQQFHTDDDKKTNDSSGTKILLKPKHKTPGTFTIGEIVVRERAIATIEEASTTTEITAKDIEAHGDKLLADSLRMVPGLQIVERKKGNQEFELRGYGMDRVALLIDGIPITDAYGGNMDIGNISVVGLSKIIVTRGASSALYGCRGTVGTINMVTQRPDKLFGKASVEYGMYNNVNVNLTQGAPVGKFYYWISGTFDKSDGYRASHALDYDTRLDWVEKLTTYNKFIIQDPDTYLWRPLELSDFPEQKALQAYLSDTGRVRHISHTKYNVSGKLGYEIIDGLEIGVSAFYNNTEKRGSTYQSTMTSDWIPSLKSWQPVPLSSEFFSNMSNNWVEYYNYSVVPYVFFEWKDLSIRLNGFYYEQSNTLEGFKDPYEDVYAWQMTDSTAYWSIWTSHSYGFNLYPSYKICSWNKLNTAVSFRVDDHLKEEKPQSQAWALINEYGYGTYKTQFIESYTLTVAIEDEFNFNERVRMTIGLSYDMQELTQFNRKPKIGEADYVVGSTKMLKQYIAKDDSILGGTRDFFSPVLGISGDSIEDLLTLRGSLAYKAHFPNLEQYSNTVESKAVINEKISIDTIIKPEKSLNANIGFDLSFLNKALSLRADYFCSLYQDKIESVYDQQTGDKQYFNVDSALVNGIETSIGGNWIEVGGIADISFSVSYTFMDIKNQSDIQDTDIKKGERFEFKPAHQIGFDIRTDFVSGTSVNLWLISYVDQIKYVMKTVPDTHDPFSLNYFKAMRLHDPFFLNIKISQNITEHFTIYVMGKNLLDDYNADPLNPGEGCMFYWGASAQL